jgi:hypothetical protein
MDPQTLLDRRDVRTIFIDNRDRNTNLDANHGDNFSNSAPYSFVVDLESSNIEKLINVSTVELKGLSFPKIENENYVIVDISEFSGLIDSTDNASNRVFGIAYFDGVTSGSGSGLQVGDVKPIKGSDFIKKLAVFEPPRMFSKLHINFRTHGGNLVTKAMVGNVENISMILQFETIHRNLN